MVINPVIETLTRFCSLSENTIQELASLIQFDHFTKNTDLLEIGKRAKNMFYVQKGLVRVYYYHDGRDVTDYFAIDGQFIGAVPSLINGQPSLKGIQILEASDLYFFSMAEFEACCARHHDLEHATRRMMGYALLEEQERIESLRFYSVRERYNLMEKKYPGIMNRCPLHYVASYLGTTQVSISRIRAGVQ
jgi:CRP-like cAMP-binding protein